MEGTHEVEKDLPLACQEAWRAGHFHKPGPVALLEHVLTALEPHPASLTAKMEAFAMLNGLTAMSVQHELAHGSELQQRSAAYLRHAVASGEHPRLAALLAQGFQDPEEAVASAGPEDGYADILARVLTGLLKRD